MATGLNPKIIFKIKNQALMMKIRILNVIVLQRQKFNMQVCFKYRARIEGAFFFRTSWERSTATSCPCKMYSFLMLIYSHFIDGIMQLLHCTADVTKRLLDSQYSNSMTLHSNLMSLYTVYRYLMSLYSNLMPVLKSYIFSLYSYLM